MIRKIAKIYNVKVIYKNLSHSAYIECNKRTIVMNRVVLKYQRIAFSSLFHEISHMICYDNNIYKSYHKPKSKKQMMSNALNAERYVDIQGEKLMKFFFPKLKYCRSYRKKSDGIWLREFYERVGWR